ncbi:ImmA/IrrE family metallo-endopeptidase [uncultured Roseobacter sp.]|uniref:helix-turn-helix domain-containing protein n=1 Tax=uncultured Roseobacter sp. TaxID=114847 RepID=UPI00262FE512|nr:ImmA/IrrE family metallo-endopeptidase [uncultured Roseobacter sp.]
MTATFNQDLLRIARQARGWSQSELSRRAQISQANISKLENGIIGPSEDVISKLCDTLGFPNDFFLQNDRVIGLPMSVQYRKKASVGQKAIERLEAELNIRILHIRRLLDATELEPELALPRMEVDEYGGNPEHIAELVRRTWLVPSGPIRDLVDWVERAGCIVVHCDFAALKVDGFTVQIPDMPPCIFLNRNQPSDRQRFSLAHELGHVVMHRVPSPEMEDEANSFAASLLMPARDIRPLLAGKKLTIQRLASLKPVWRVSMAALLVRAKTLETITRNQSGYLWRQISSMGYRKSEPPELDFDIEQPSVLPEIIKLHLEDLGYDVSDLAKALHSSEDDLKALHTITETKSHLRIVK